MEVIPKTSVSKWKSMEVIPKTLVSKWNSMEVIPKTSVSKWKSMEVIPKTSVSKWKSMEKRAVWSVYKSQRLLDVWVGLGYISVYKLHNIFFQTRYRMRILNIYVTKYIVLIK